MTGSALCAVWQSIWNTVDFTVGSSTSQPHMRCSNHCSKSATDALSSSANGRRVVPLVEAPVLQQVQQRVCSRPLELPGEEQAVGAERLKKGAGGERHRIDRFGHLHIGLQQQLRRSYARAVPCLGTLLLPHRLQQPSHVMLTSLAGRQLKLPNWDS